MKLEPSGFAARLPIWSPKRDHSRLPVVYSDEMDLRYKPSYAVWELTLRCDLSCRHCGSRAGHARPNELDTRQCLDLVRQLADLGVREITLIGGEAYLREDWIHIIQAIRAADMVCTMTTGGRGLTLERAQRAKVAGLQGVSVSIDGLEPTHDDLRGVKGSFASALAAMENARNADLPVSVNTQLNRQSLPDLSALADLLIRKQIRSWQVAVTVPMGRASDEPELLFQPYDLLDLFPILADVKARCDQGGVALWPANNVGYFGPYEAHLRDRFPGKHMCSCSAGKTSIGIEADGTIKGCPSLPTESYQSGNMKDHPLNEIWGRAEPLRYTRNRTVDDLWGYCRSCYYNESCMAGCTWTSHVVFGRPGNNPYCHHRALEMDRIGKRERIVRTKESPGAPFDHGVFEIVVEDRA